MQNEYVATCIDCGEEIDIASMNVGDIDFTNIHGISMPFIRQSKPGPISNDIVKNIWENF